VPATYAETAVTSTTMVMPVRCAASFSNAIRRIPRGVVATNSMLPRRVSPASVPDRAMIDHRAASRPIEAAVFHWVEPPRVVMLLGYGLPYTPDIAGGSWATRFARSSRDCSVA
jgi:hypothetical protein